MNILYVSTKKRWGGVVSWMFKTAQGLEKKGHKVWLISHPDASFNQSYPIPERLVIKKFGFDYHPLSILWLINFIKNKKIDIVLNNIQKEMIFSGIAAKITHRPCVRRVGREDDFNIQSARKKRHEKYIQHSIVPCRYLKDYGLKTYNWLNDKEISVVYNGRNPAEFSQEAIDSKRNSWGIQGKDIIIGTTSQLTTVKQIDGIIKVFKKATEILRNYPLKLVITGKGPELENLKNLSHDLSIENKVIFPGFSDNPLLTAACYDIAVSNSALEGFANTIVEYMAAGTPVCSTITGGVKEIIEHGQNGFLYEVGDTTALSRILLDLTKNENLRKAISVSGKKTIASQFSEDKMIHHVEKIFKSLIETYSTKKVRQQ